MESFFCSPGRKKLPGKHGQQDLSADPVLSGKTPNSFKNLRFPTWHGFRSDHSEPRLGRAWRFAQIRKRPGRARCASSKGRTTDGEYASRRTFAADGAGT